MLDGAVTVADHGRSGEPAATSTFTRPYEPPIVLDDDLGAVALVASAFMAGLGVGSLVTILLVTA